MTVRLAFCGTGYIAKIHAAAAAKLADVEIVAVADPFKAQREEFAKKHTIKRQYDDLKDLIADGDVDAISINTPNYLHAPLSIAALNAGIHVMVEKPMAINVAESLQMIDLAQKNDKRLMVAHCWRISRYGHPCD